MSLLDKLLDRAASEPGLHFRNPPLPHTCSIPSGLAVGSKIYIQGVVNANADRFVVNLQRGADTDSADIYFHFNPRVADGIVIRNCRAGGEWGEEEKEGESPFAPLAPFLIVISAFLEGYEVEVNGKSFITYKHHDNLPLANVTHLALYGDATISAVHIPVANMPKKFRIAIPGKVKCGDIFTIKGTVPAGAERFVVNLQCGPGMNDDVVFHFNPRFADNAVIRNSRVDEQWAQEEREGGMPFTEGQPFDLKIVAAAEGFRTWINGSPFVSFSHRLDMSTACILLVEDDVEVSDVLIDCAPSHLPWEFEDNAARDYKISSLQLYYPGVPTTACIGPALSPGKVVIVSGMVDKEPTRFSANLQCHSSDDSDIACHINPRFDDQLVVLNSRADSSWGDEIRLADMPFRAGSQFDLQILCKDDAYHLAVNGVKCGEFPHRIPNGQVNHIMVDGCVTVYRILAV